MEFLPVRINTLRPGHPVNFDIFVAVAGKHIHYIRSLESFDENRLIKLKQKGVKKLFIDAASEPNYLEYLDAGLDGLGNKNEDLSKRGLIAQDTLTRESENMERNLETEEGYKKTEGRVTKVIEFLSSEAGALKSVLGSMGVSQDQFQHGSTVASLSLGLALKIGGLNAREQFDLAMAGLTHDLGIQKLGLDAMKPKDQYTPEEKKLYLKHPQAAVDILSQKRFVTPGLLRLILDHEEVGEGEGFPERKNLAKLPLTSQILNLCDEFDRLSIEKKIPATELIKIFFQEKAHLFDLDHISKLGEVIAGK